MIKFERILHLSKLTQEDRWQSEEPDKVTIDEVVDRRFYSGNQLVLTTDISRYYLFVL